MKQLWLDDVRDPKQHGYPDATWVKTFEEFKQAVLKEWPDFVSFDHDLGYEYHWKETQVFEEGDVPPEEHEILYDDYVEKTGYHAARWLVDYCIDHNKKLPWWNVHSGNPVGKQNIQGLLKNYEQFCLNEKLNKLHNLLDEMNNFLDSQNTK